MRPLTLMPKLNPPLLSFLYCKKIAQRKVQSLYLSSQFGADLSPAISLKLWGNHNSTTKFTSMLPKSEPEPLNYL